MVTTQRDSAAAESVVPLIRAEGRNVLYRVLFIYRYQLLSKMPSSVTTDQGLCRQGEQ